MKKIKIRLMLLVGVSVIATFFIVLSVFNLSMMYQIKRNVMESVDYMLAENEEEIPEQTIYLSNLLSLDSNYSVISKFDITEWQEHIEEGIAVWCSEHRILNKIMRAHILDRDYYLTMMETTDYDGNYEILVLYVDISGEMQLIRSINIAILIVMFFMGIGAGTLGYMTGNQIERSQTAQKTFFENTSHELKTPLTAIRGYAEGLLTDVVRDDKKAAHIILKETEKMTLLIDDILSCARLESGNITLKTETVNLREMIEDCLLPLEGTVRKKNLQIEIDIEDGQITADPNQLERALNNVLTNAMKYANRKIQLNYDGEKLKIWNDGNELTDEDMKHIFDRFYIGNSGSTGIGLALTKEIASLHGWKLQVEKSRQGIAFVFDFNNRQ